MIRMTDLRNKFYHTLAYTIKFDDISKNKHLMLSYYATTILTIYEQLRETEAILTSASTTIWST